MPKPSPDATGLADVDRKARSSGPGATISADNPRGLEERLHQLGPRDCFGLGASLLFNLMPSPPWRSFVRGSSRSKAARRSSDVTVRSILTTTIRPRASPRAPVGAPASSSALAHRLYARHAGCSAAPTDRKAAAYLWYSRRSCLRSVSQRRVVAGPISKSLDGSTRTDRRARHRKTALNSLGGIQLRIHAHIWRSSTRSSS